MEAKELRLSNLVYEYLEVFPEMKEVRVVDTVTIAIINGEVKTNRQLLHAPIPLTEEWLLRFGFYELKKKKHYQHEHLDVEIEKQGNVFAVVISDYEHGVSHFILHSKFVHNFQNNIFALTGEELTLKNE